MALATKMASLFIPEGLVFALDSPIVLTGQSAKLHLLSEGAGALFLSTNRSRFFEVRDGAELHLSHVHLRGWSEVSCALSSGGALHISSASKAVLSNSSIANCSATSVGGAVHVERGSQLELHRTRISHCSAGVSCGGIEAGDGSLVQLTFCNIEACRASRIETTASVSIRLRLKGGGIHAANSQLTLNSSCISR